MIVRIAAQYEVDAIWPKITEKIAKACKRYGDDISSSGLWQMCRSGSAFLVIAHEEDGTILMGSVWRFEQWASGTALKCLCLAGTAPVIWAEQGKDLIRTMRDEGGANKVIFEGRDGWQRVFDCRRIRSVYEVSL